LPPWPDSAAVIGRHRRSSSAHTRPCSAPRGHSGYCRAAPPQLHARGTNPRPLAARQSAGALVGASDLVAELVHGQRCIGLDSVLSRRSWDIPPGDCAHRAGDGRPMDHQPLRHFVLGACRRGFSDENDDDWIQLRARIVRGRFRGAAAAHRGCASNSASVGPLGFGSRSPRARRAAAAARSRRTMSLVPWLRI
jgi:hypothetical protein